VKKYNTIILAIIFTLNLALFGCSFTSGDVHDQVTVVGQITNKKGEPIPDLPVNPEPTFFPRPPIPEIGISTDENGEYSLHLPPGNYNFNIIDNGEAILTENVNIKRGEKEKRLDFTIDP